MKTIFRSLIPLCLLFGSFALIAPAGASADGDILVRYKPGTSGAEKKQLRAATDTELVDRYSLVPGLELLSSDQIRSSLKELRQDDQVLYAERNPTYYPAVAASDPYYHLQWGLKNTGTTILGTPGIVGADIRIEAAWDVESDAESSPIAVIDTGIDLIHSDLENNIWVNPDEIPGNGIDDDGNGYVDDVHGWNFVDDNNVVQDIVRTHGTRVAGVIGAGGDNGFGISGVNKNTQIVSLKVCEAQCAGSDIIAAIQYAANKGIRISNNSYGSDEFSQAVYDAAAYARNAGHLMVVAAGNQARNFDNQPTYPADFNLDNIIAVGATDNRDQLSSFSNFGNRIDIAAPGTNIVTTSPGDSWVWASGTSFAAPFVAGVANLVAEVRPNWSYTWIRNQILNNARTVPGLVGKINGGKMLNATGAMQFNFPPAPTITAKPNRYTNQTSHTIAWTGQAGNTFKCSFNDQAWQACSSPITYSGLQDGTYSFRVTQLSTEDESPETSVIWTQDRVAPAKPTFSYTPPAKSNERTAGFAWNIEEDNTYHCSWNNEPYTTCKLPNGTSRENMPNGQHTFSVVARDQAGNQSEPAAWSWLINKVLVSSPRPLNGSTIYSKLNQVRIAFQSEEEKSLCQMRQIQNNIPFPCQSPLILKDLAVGRYTLSIYQEDEFSNLSPPAIVKIVIDQTRPVIQTAKSKRIRKNIHRITCNHIDSSPIGKTQISRSGLRSAIRVHHTKAGGCRSFRLESKTRPRWIRIMDRAGNWSSWKYIQS